MSYCERGTIQIGKADNGFTVTLRDPVIEKKNAQRSLKDRMNTSPEPYVDPTRTYVFTTWDDMLAFMKKNGQKALPDVTYESAFAALNDD